MSKLGKLPTDAEFAEYDRLKRIYKAAKTEKERDKAFDAFMAYAMAHGMVEEPGPMDDED